MRRKYRDRLVGLEARVAQLEATPQVDHQVGPAPYLDTLPSEHTRPLIDTRAPTLGPRWDDEDPDEWHGGVYL